MTLFQEAKELRDLDIDNNFAPKIKGVKQKVQPFYVYVIAAAQNRKASAEMKSKIQINTVVVNTLPLTAFSFLPGLKPLLSCETMTLEQAQDRINKVHALLKEVIIGVDAFNKLSYSDKKEQVFEYPISYAIVYEDGKKYENTMVLRKTSSTNLLEHQAQKLVHSVVQNELAFHREGFLDLKAREEAFILRQNALHDFVDSYYTTAELQPKVKLKMQRHSAGSYTAIDPSGVEHSLVLINKEWVLKTCLFKEEFKGVFNTKTLALQEVARIHRRNHLCCYNPYRK